MRKIILKIILISFIINPLCYAASELYSNEELKEAIAANPYEPNYFVMILGLFIVIALIYLTGFIYQKLIGINLKDDSKNFINKAEIISTTPLGQNKNLHVIKINNDYILIGSTQNSINHIKDIKITDLKLESGQISNEQDNKNCK